MKIYFSILISLFTVCLSGQTVNIPAAFCECETYNLTVTGTAGQAISLNTNIGTITPASFTSTGSDVVQLTTICTNSLDPIRTSNLFVNGSPTQVQLKERNGDFVIWLIGDPHSDTDGTFNIANARNQLTSFNINWDIGLMVGDYTGQAGPTVQNGLDYANDAGSDINRIYEVIGNHDADVGLNWFNTYIDPTNRAGRPYAIQAVNGSNDAYTFKAHNIQITGLYDRNEVPFPAGKDFSTEAGYPAGTYSTDAVGFWSSYLNDTSVINLTFAHHLLYQSTSYTELFEAYNEGIHNTYSWYDRRGSSFVYGIWDGADVSTVDNLNLAKLPNPKAYVKFKPILGCYDNHHIWVAGHTHPRTTAYDIDAQGRRMMEEYSWGTVINSGNLTENHGAGLTPHVFTRFIHFYDGHDEAIIRTFTHENTTAGSNSADVLQVGNIFTVGFENPLEKKIQIKTNFQL